MSSKTVLDVAKQHNSSDAVFLSALGCKCSDCAGLRAGRLKENDPSTLPPTHPDHPDFTPEPVVIAPAVGASQAQIDAAVSSALKAFQKASDEQLNAAVAKAVAEVKAAQPSG
jgi:hypothetical protein